MAEARQDLPLVSPWVNAAGALGFRPPRSWPWPERMGAFITHPVSLAPRAPAKERGLAAYSGGFLMHTGLPNPGLSRVLSENRARWTRSAVPVWVHLMASEAEEIRRMADRLESLPEVGALEIGIPPWAGADLALRLVDAALGELPVVVSLPYTQADSSWVARLRDLGVNALHLSAPYGSYPNGRGGLLHGRLYGPHLLPLALETLQRAQSAHLPVIVSGGVFLLEHGQALLAAGALAVGLDAVLWRAGPGDAAPEANLD